MNIQKFKTLICTLFLLVFLTLESFASPLNLTLTYNNATNTVTANWRLPFPRAITTYTWTDQSGVQVGFGTTPLNSTSILVPYNAASLTCEISIQNGEVLLKDGSTIDFDIIIDDDLVFLVVPNPSKCNEINISNPSTGTEGFGWIPQNFNTPQPIPYSNNGFLYQLSVSSSSLYSTYTVNQLINEKLKSCSNNNACNLNSSNNIQMTCLHNPFSFTNRVRTIPSKSNPKKRLKSISESVNVLSNPFDSELNFRLDLSEKGQASLSILDAVGRTVIQKNNIELNGYILDLSVPTEELNSGIYYYQFVVNGEIYTQGKIVKQQ
jgi:hypothetical protein